MARIRGITDREAGLVARLAYRFSQSRFGEVAEPLRVTAHHPRLMLGYGALELAADRSKLVNGRLKELATIKVAAQVGCEFCIDIGSAIGRESGISEEQLRGLSRYKESQAFSELEKLVMEYAEEMTRTPAEIPEALFDALREHFDEAQLVELTAVIALENYRARFNHAFGIGSQGFSGGAYCPVPEKTASRASGSG